MTDDETKKIVVPDQSTTKAHVFPPAAGVRLVSVKPLEVRARTFPPRHCSPPSLFDYGNSVARELDLVQRLAPSAPPSRPSVSG
jgi:hypothetical protein